MAEMDDRPAGHMEVHGQLDVNPNDLKLLRRFGVVKLWPKIKTAEDESIERLKIAAKRIGVECIIVDMEGRCINPPRVLVTKEDVDFIIHLHFETPKIYDVFSFVALWNPLQFYFDWGYRRFSSNLLTHDDFLSCSSPWADDHVKRLAVEDPYRDTTLLMTLYHSVSEPIFEPSLGEKKIMYVGINWEKISGNLGRFDPILKSLDKKGILNIYGPKVFQGVKVWNGFKSYIGPLPFDGQSVVEAARKAGISLVLSSNSHKQSELMSSRLFEALAAGSMVICDENFFAKRFFGDTLLYIDSSKPEDDIRDQILAHHHWIINNESKALAMIRDAQKIFKETFSLDKSLQKIYKDFPRRKELLRSIRFPRSTEKMVFLFLLCPVFSIFDLKVLMESTSSQNYPNYLPIFVFDELDYQENKYEIEKFLILQFEEKIKKEYRLILGKFNERRACDYKERIGFIGSAIEETVAKISEEEYFCFIAPNERLLSDHISSLVRVLEDNPEAPFSMSDEIKKHISNEKTFYDLDLKYDPISTSMESCGRFLFRKTRVIEECFSALRYINFRIPAIFIKYYSILTCPSTKRATLVQDVQHIFFYDRLRCSLFEKEIWADITQSYRFPKLFEPFASKVYTLEILNTFKDYIKFLPMPKFLLNLLRFMYQKFRQKITLKKGYDIFHSSTHFHTHICQLEKCKKQ